MQLANDLINRHTVQTDWIRAQVDAGNMTPGEGISALIILWSNSYTGEHHHEYITHALEMIQRPDMAARARHDQVDKRLECNMTVDELAAALQEYA